MNQFFSLRKRTAALLLFSALVAFPACAKTRHPDVNSLNKNSREIFITAMQWGDQYWDAKTKLCRSPSSFNSEMPMRSNYFMVRESSWYALGLLLRDQPGDRDRAAQVLREVLKQQYREPGKPWDGTFRRSPNEPEPGAKAAMWRAYDPNWRVFIGTTFAVILNEYPDRIPAALAHDLVESIDYAIAGEMKEGRLLPSYTNISLMYGYLWNYAAVHGNRPEWAAPAAKWQEEVFRLFKQHDAFFEYNSPTYSGTDLYGLALWRDYGFTPRMRGMGSEMEAALWRTTADLYSANLRNIAGPYDRAYGMDMQSYVSIMGLWMRMALDADKAPLADLDRPQVDHVPDLWFIPLMVVVDAKIPPDAMKSFTSFQGEHEVRRPIENKRIATAWIGKNAIYGGEITGKTKDVGPGSQFHPVTVQWQAPGRIGWIQMTRCPMIDAVADKKGIAIVTAPGDVSFRIFAPDIAVAGAKAAEWTLPGLTVHIDADAKGFKAEQHGSFVDVTYTGMTKMTMTFKTAGE